MRKTSLIVCKMHMEVHSFGNLLDVYSSKTQNARIDWEGRTKYSSLEDEGGDLEHHLPARNTSTFQ